MYVRLKTNRSESTTVVVVEKNADPQVYVKSVGTSSNPEEIARFTKTGERYIEEENKRMQPELDFEGAGERALEAKLGIRPIFLFNEGGIKAHISICFIALKVYRELDRMLKDNRMKLSVDTVLGIAKTIPTVCVKMKDGTLTKTLFLTKRQQPIKPLFDDEFWGSQTSAENQ